MFFPAGHGIPTLLCGLVSAPSFGDPSPRSLDGFGGIEPEVAESKGARASDQLAIAALQHQVLALESEVRACGEGRRPERRTRAMQVECEAFRSRCLVDICIYTYIYIYAYGKIFIFD